MDYTIKAEGSSRPWLYHILVKTFGEDATRAKHGVTMKSARGQQKPDRPPAHWQVGKLSLVATMNTPGMRSTARTRIGMRTVTNGNDRFSSRILSRFNDKSQWNKLWRAIEPLHHADPLVKASRWDQQTSPKVSQSQYWTRIYTNPSIDEHGVDQAAHGLMISTPKPSKSLVLRVASVN